MASAWAIAAPIASPISSLKYGQTARISWVLFLRQAEDRAASLTIWEDRGAVEALQSSPPYREAIHELAEGALLVGDQSVEILEVESGDFRLEALVRALDQTRFSKRRRADSNR